MRKICVSLFIIVCFIQLYIKVFVLVGDGYEMVFVGFGYRLEGIVFFVVFVKVYGYKYSSFYLFDELLGFFYVIFFYLVVYGKYYQVDGWNCCLKIFYFCQEVFFCFVYFLFGRFFVLMLVVQVIGMKNVFVLQMDQKGDVYICRIECLNMQYIIFVFFIFINIDCIFFLCLMVFQNVF